jgi:hypothetical protein
MTLERLAMDGKQRRESDGEVAIAKALSANVLGLWLILVGAAALAISMFLPLAQSAGGVPIVGNNTLFQEIGWRVFFLPLFLVSSGYHASQGKPGARWFLISLCAIAAVGIALFGSDEGLRTLYPLGPGDTTQPGVVTSLDIAIYVAAAGVVVAFIGALTFRRSAGKEMANVGPIRQRNTGVHEMRVPPGPEGNPQPEQAIRRRGELRVSDRQRAHNVVLSASG